jgi:hypothetical protein
MMLGASAAIAVLTFGIWYAATQRTMGGGDSPTERTVTIAEGRLCQKTLCVTPSRTFDAPTRNALMKFNAAFSYPGTDAPSVIYDDSDLSNLRSAQSMFPDCEKAGFLSSFEVGLFTRFGAARIHTYLNQALIRADIAVPVAFSNEPLMLNRAARMAIASLSKKYGLGDVDEITPLFYDRMIKSLAK